jgi:putative colanic acid biosynthesis acetyltransferase WcaF
MKRDLEEFRGKKSNAYQKIRFVLWIFLSRSLLRLLPSKSFYIFLLRIFGAKVGSNITIRNSVVVHFPWNLEIGDNCWIGEQVWFINHEKILIGSNVCISQRSIICSSGHDYRSSSLEYAHKPVIIKDGAWVCLDAKVLPGVKIGECSVVSAGETVRQSLPDYSMLIGGQVRKIYPPK